MRWFFRHFQLGLALHQLCLCRGDVGLPLCNSGQGRAFGAFGVGHLGQGLIELGGNGLCIHPGDHITLQYEIPFVDQNVLDPAGTFGRDVDFSGLDAAIALNEAAFVGLGPEKAPPHPECGEGEHRKDGPEENFFDPGFTGVPYA